MKKGDKIFVQDYKCISNGTAISILRPAEISWEPKEGDELVMVRFLDEKFRKGGRASYSMQVLRSKIVEK